MLENFVKINQFPRLVKQQLGSLVRISFRRARESAREPCFLFYNTPTDPPNFFKKIHSCPLLAGPLFVYLKNNTIFFSFPPHISLFDGTRIPMLEFAQSLR
ncbi:MAG: hypothetical protein L6364_09655, partial [Desulfobulbaceae bacterium]|nr:hypothetical protein [Desulfobulbaceae bacterium]